MKLFNKKQKINKKLFSLRYLIYKNFLVDFLLNFYYKNYFFIINI